MKKEAVTKACENEDCCVGEEKKEEGEMAVERNYHVVAASILTGL